MISPEKLSQPEPDAVNDSLPVGKEAIAKSLIEQINDANMTPLIALPDIYGLTPACQVANQYPPDVDRRAWRINMILLLGIAAHKTNTASSAHLARDETPTILGVHPSDILKEFFAPDSDERILVDELKIPLSRQYKRLLSIPGISPDSCPKLLSKIKSIAERELMHEIYTTPEDPVSLNPKVAFLWGGITSWKAWNLSTDFRNWLAGFRARAKNQIFLSLIEDIEAGDQQADAALDMAMNVRSETLEANIIIINSKASP